MSNYADYVKNLESRGELDPNCKFCKDHFYSRIEKGELISNIFAPRHKASLNCRSGKHSHCTCDCCF